MSGYRLEEVRVENIRNLRLVRLDIGGKSTRITGPNGAGKTAFFDAVRWCLAGRGKPIREGADRCEVELTLADGSTAKLEIRRSATREGAPRVEVSLDGKAQSSPQKFLDSLKTALTFNPLEFDRLCETAEGRRKQRDILAEIAGVQARLTELQVEYEARYAERTRANADVRAAEAALNAVPAVRPDTPDVLVDVATLQAKQRELQARRSAAAQWQHEHDRLEMQVTARVHEADDLDREIARLTAKREAVKAEAIRLEGVMRAMPEPPPAPTVEEAQALEKAVTDAVSVNASVQRKRLRAQARERLSAAERQATTLDDALARIEQDKRRVVKEAHYPLDGLSFDDSGAVYLGRRYEDWNSAERARISTAITVHQNSELNLIFLDDADGIGEDIKESIIAQAELHGKQVIFGCYQETAGPVGIHIELGEVVAVDGKEPA